MKNNEALCSGQHNDPSILFRRSIKGILLVIFVVICCEFGHLTVDNEAETSTPLTIFDIIHDYSVDLRCFESDIERNPEWNCVQYSNAYLDKNPDWHVLEIQSDLIINGVHQNHAVNFIMVNNTIIVRDVGLELQYNFTEWDELRLRVWDDHIPAGKHFFVRNL